MPGFDGTGPRGSGPMTGSAQGYCLLKVPYEPGEPMRGLAGRQGRPVTIAPVASRATEVEHLRLQETHVEKTLAHVRRRIGYLEALRDIRMERRQG